MHNGNLEVKNNIIYIPEYMMMCVVRKNGKELGIVKPVLDGLTSER